MYNGKTVSGVPVLYNGCQIALPNVERAWRALAYIQVDLFSFACM
jgi:hypothetical protein